MGNYFFIINKMKFALVAIALAVTASAKIITHTAAKAKIVLKHKAIKNATQKAAFVKSKGHQTSHAIDSKDPFIKLINHGDLHKFKAFKELAKAHRVKSTSSASTR